MKELLAPFTEEAIITAKLRDVLDPEAETIGARQAGQLVGGRAGQTVTGARVYNPEDSAGDKLAKSFVHILDGIIPSVIPIDARSGEIEASRFARGVVNGLGLEDMGVSTKDRMNRERELSKELARAFSGITENPIESTALKFKGYEFGKARQNANNIFTTVSNRANASSDDFLKAYITANEALFRVQSRMYNIMEDMKTIGMNEQQIRKVFKEAGIGGYKKILQGKFDPIDISPTVRKNVRRNELDLPRKEINRIKSELRDQPLGTVRVPEPEADIPEAQIDLSQTTQQSAAPTTAPAQPVQQGQAQPSTRTNPAFLGSDIFSAMKNMMTFGQGRQ